MLQIFISHAVTDQALAKSLAKCIEAGGPDIKAFVASRAGDIRADADWTHGVERALRDADAYVILLTVNSVLRPWVNFETGAAWFSERTCILVRAGLTPEEIPLPLSSKQVYSLEGVDDAQAVFDALKLKPVAIPALVAEAVSFTRQMKQLTGEVEPAWEGVEFQGTFFAWAGPLLQLDDKAAIPYPPQLVAVLRQRGLSVSFGNPEKLSHHFGRGRCQVFATDRKSWRRPVVKDQQLLLVARPEDMQ